jgi:hypothetical protein
MDWMVSHAVEAAPAGAQNLRRRRGGGDCVDGRIRTVSSSSLLDRGHRCWRGAPPPLHHSTTTSGGGSSSGEGSAWSSRLLIALLGCWQQLAASA